jgi:type VI secretion system Hcp family effector
LAKINLKKLRFVIKLVFGISVFFNLAYVSARIPATALAQNGSRIKVSIEGVATNQDPIEAYSISGGITSSSGGPVNFEDLSITKGIDKTTPKLALKVAEGSHPKLVDLNIYTVANNVETLFLTIRLDMDVRITASNVIADPTKALTSPIETVKFCYQRITYTYRIPEVQGSLIFTYDRMQSCF